MSPSQARKRRHIQRRGRWCLRAGIGMQLRLTQTAQSGPTYTTTSHWWPRVRRTSKRQRHLTDAPLQWLSIHRQVFRLPGHFGPAFQRRAPRRRNKAGREKALGVVDGSVGRCLRHFAAAPSATLGNFGDKEGGWRDKIRGWNF